MKTKRLLSLFVALMLSTLTASAAHLWVQTTSASPSSGSGADLQFSIRFGALSPATGTWYVVHVGPGYGPVGSGTANACEIAYNSGYTGGGNASGWELVNDAGTGVTFPGNTGVTENSQCMFMVTGSSYVASSQTVTMTWHMRFTSAVNNQALGIWVYGAVGGQCGSGQIGDSCTGWIKVGTWTPTSASGGFVGPYYDWQPITAFPFAEGSPSEISKVAPGNSTGVDWCLYYAEGPLFGQPAPISGVNIDYFTFGVVAGSGGHTHETTANQRPASVDPQIKPVNPSPSNPNIGVTDASGCATFTITANFYSGYWNTTAYTTNCNLPGIVCYQDNNEVDVQVISTAYDGSPMTRIGSDPGYTMLNSQDHGTNGMYGSINLPVFDIGAAYNSAPADVGHPFTINAASLLWGGAYDRPSTGTFWMLPVTADPHTAGYSFDVYSPSTGVTKANFLNAVNKYCPIPEGVSENVFDFYTQQPVSITQATNTTTYLWHVYCSQIFGLPVYPN